MARSLHPKGPVASGISRSLNTSSTVRACGRSFPSLGVATILAGFFSTIPSLSNVNARERIYMLLAPKRGCPACESLGLPGDYDSGQSTCRLTLHREICIAAIAMHTPSTGQIKTCIRRTDSRPHPGHLRKAAPRPGPCHQAPRPTVSISRRPSPASRPSIPFGSRISARALVCSALGCSRHFRTRSPLSLMPLRRCSRWRGVA